AGDGCMYSVSPLNFNLPPAGGTALVQVTPSAANCMWMVTPNVPWISVTPQSGMGSGVVMIDVSSNPTINMRTGSVNAGGNLPTITQIGTTISALAGTGAAPVIGGIVNAASFAAANAPNGPLGRGSFIAIFGTNVGPDAPLLLSAFPFLPALGDVSIKI